MAIKVVQIMVLAIFFGLFVSLSSFAASEPEKKCEPPKEGPMWIRKFSAERKEDLSIDWDPEEKTATYVIKGKYREPLLNPDPKLTKYDHKTWIKIVEKWGCGADLKSTFISLSGKMEQELNWKRETEEEIEKFESEDEFEIISQNESHHVKHEEERTNETKNDFIKKSREENTEWTQKWNSENIPSISGKFTSESTEQIRYPSDPKVIRMVISSPVMVPGETPTELAPGRFLKVETKQTGIINGPLDPIETETVTTVEQSEKDILVEEKKIVTKSIRKYEWDKKENGYRFVSLDETYREALRNRQEGSYSSLNKLDTWSDLANPPDKSSFWKETHRNLATGKSTNVTVQSKGHGILPPLFNVQSKDGTFMRITDYNNRGRITRFLVLYFPPGDKGNDTKLDLKFSDNGSLTDFTVDDGRNTSSKTSEAEALKDPAELISLQNRVHEVKEMEKLPSFGSLPPRKLRELDYPVLYQDKL